jgi:enoyl-[acyl-carrier-protein] reductase (NADH)
LAKLAEPLMKDGGTLSTMTYYGSQMVVEISHHYHCRPSRPQAGLATAWQG